VIPEVSIIVLTMHDELLYGERALRAGARGYIMKLAGGDRVVEGIRAIFQGRIALSPRMATRLLEEYSGAPADAGCAHLANLTDREFEILQLIGEAKSNREVAGHLHLSPKTVESHRVNLMRKLRVRTPAELLRFAIYQEGNNGRVQSGPESGMRR
jgi:DNA-binding NarL/FixJ family response regulator